MAQVIIYSTLTGRPFIVNLENYPHNELPRLSDQDITDLHAKTKDEITDLEITLIRAEQVRARKKVRHFKRAK